MALQKTLALPRCRVEPPFRFSSPANWTYVGVKVDKARGGARRRGGRNKAIDVVLGVRRLLVAMNVVVTGFAQGTRLINPVDEVNPMEIIFPVDRVIKVCACPLAGSPGRESGYVMTAETEIEVVGTPGRRTRKSIQVIRPPNAPVYRAVRTHRR